METSIEGKSQIQRKIKIVVPAEDVKKKYEEVCKQIKKDAKVDGFRKGKVPTNVIEVKFKNEIQTETMQNIIQEFTLKAIQENDLKSIGSPMVEKINPIDKDSDYTYEVVVEVYPEIKDINFKDFELEKKLYKCTDEEIDAQLKMIQKSLSLKEEIKEGEKVKKDYFVRIDCETFLNDTAIKPFDNFNDTNQIIQIGNSIFPEEVEKNIIGMVKDEEKEFKATLSDKFVKKEYADKEILFKIKVHEIRKESLPEIDDEMAKQINKNFKTLEELKNQIQTNLQEGYDKRSEQELSEQIFQNLLKQTDMEVPKALIEYELDLIVNEAKNMFKAYNTTLEQIGQSEEMIREKYKQSAEDKAKRHIMLSTIGKQEKIEVLEEDFMENYKKIAANFNASVDEVKKVYENNLSQKEALSGAIIESKVMSLILENSNIKEVTPIQEKEK